MEKKEFIVNNENLTFNEEELETLKGMEKYIEETSKKCLLKFYNAYEMDNIKALQNKPLELKVFWAIQRDLKLYIDEKTQMLQVLWRVEKNEYLPQLTKVVKYKHILVFHTREYNDEDNTWHDRKIKYGVEQYEQTCKKYKEVIEEIRNKYYANC